MSQYLTLICLKVLILNEYTTIHTAADKISTPIKAVLILAIFFIF